VFRSLTRIEAAQEGWNQRGTKYFVGGSRGNATATARQTNKKAKCGKKK